MKISIIGCGYVGTVTGVCFADLGNDIVFYDIIWKTISPGVNHRFMNPLSMT